MFIPPGDFGCGFDPFLVEIGFLGAFVAILDLGALLAVATVLPALMFSGTKLCLLTGGAVDLRAVGCLDFLVEGLEKIVLGEESFLLRD